jgi:hypothetical protein
MDTCPIFTAVARDLQLDPDLLLTTPGTATDHSPQPEGTVSADAISGTADA